MMLRALSRISLAVIALACAKDTPLATAGEATIQEELRLDANAEDFSRVSDVVVGAHGEIIVALPQDAALRFYDSTGKRIASVGRKGDAPGEFRHVGLVGVKADTIWVQDAEAANHTYLSPRGELLRVEDLRRVVARITPDYTRDYQFVMPAGELPDGAMLAVGMKRPEAQAREERWEMLNISPQGVRSTVGAFDMSGSDIPFVADPIFAVATDASRWVTLVTNVSGSGGSYTVSVFRYNGEPVLVREFPFKGEVIPQRLKDSAANDIAKLRGGTELGSGSDQQSRNRTIEQMPSVYPPVQAVVLGMDETVWIALRESRDVREHIVLNAKGEELGRVKLSTRQRLVRATATQLWVIEKDSVDLTSVVRYRVQGLKSFQP